MSCLNVEGKIFLSVEAKRVSSFLIANQYMDTSVQKGKLQGKTGCIIIIVKDYFDQFSMHFTVSNYTTEWQQLKGGIVTGCTISVILLGTAMNQLLRSVDI